MAIQVLGTRDDEALLAALREIAWQLGLTGTG